MSRDPSIGVAIRADCSRLDRDRRERFLSRALFQGFHAIQTYRLAHASGAAAAATSPLLQSLSRRSSRPNPSSGEIGADSSRSRDGVVIGATAVIETTYHAARVTLGGRQGRGDRTQGARGVDRAGAQIFGISRSSLRVIAAGSCD